MRFKKLKSELAWMGKNGSKIYGYFIEDVGQHCGYAERNYHVFWGQVNGQKMFHTYRAQSWIGNHDFWLMMRKKRRIYTEMKLDTEVSRGYKLALKKDYEYHLLMRKLKNVGD